MTDTIVQRVGVEAAAHRLLNLCVTRDDILAALSVIAPDESVNRVTVEYELQILKIVGVGWGVSYFNKDRSGGKRLPEVFWNGVQAFAGALSSLTSTSVGKEVDYFSAIRERLDLYVSAMNAFPDVTDPAMVVGPTFAKISGSEENAEVIDAGRKMFRRTLAAVGEYLDSITLTDGG